MKYLLFTFLILVGIVSFAPSAEATVYYINFNCGDDATCGDGTATTSAFSGLPEFMNQARSAGDIAFVRRGNASTTDLVNITPVSDGVIGANIFVQSDMDNLWNDFSTSSETYTVTQGNNEMEASGSITGIAANDWIYVQGDCAEDYTNATKTNDCLFSYRVKSVSGTTLKLFFPYAGNQSGAGLSLRRLPAPPQWGAVTSTHVMVFDGDNFWSLRGLDLRGTNVVIVRLDGMTGFELRDSILQANGASDACITSNDNAGNLRTTTELSLYNVQFVNCDTGAIAGGDAGEHSIVILKAKQLFFDSSNAIYINVLDSYVDMQLENIHLEANDATGFIRNSAPNFLDAKIRGLYTSGEKVNVISTLTTAGSFLSVSIEDLLVLGNSVQINRLSGGASAYTILSTTTPIRTGGGATSVQVQPSTAVSNYTESGTIKLFDYPFYTNTSSKTFSQFFLGSTSTDPDFVSNPTNNELWVECEYLNYNGATTTRVRKKSTGILDFVGQPSTWQSLSVTCQPNTTGLLYFRGYYGKDEETGVDNTFFVDVAPVIQ